MPVVTSTTLKYKVAEILKKQGYLIKPDGTFILGQDNREAKKRAHDVARAERIASKEKFIFDKSSLAKQHLVDGKSLKIEKIEPRLIEVESGTEQEDLFKWWNLAWWSLPYERSYGRQMRFIIWDNYHNAPLGLVGLQSPLLSWAVRDKYLGISPEARDYWVNQSLNAQRIGALPPYNDILGGKLVALLMTSDLVGEKFRNKYKNRRTILQKRILPSRLLFITTTGAYGKSSIYTRLKFDNEEVAKFIGYTQGSGTFHIPNVLYEDLIAYLCKEGIEVKRGLGSGSSRKLRLIGQALQRLGFATGATHGIRRAVYLFSLVKNLTEIIHKGSEPICIHRDINRMTDFWKFRWALPRAQRNTKHLDFSGEEFIRKTLGFVQQCNCACQVI
jgi:hypothetical protein